MASGDTLAIFTALDGTPGALTANYATFDTRNGHPILAFDTTTQETIFFEGELPSNYSTGNIIVKLKSMMASATTGTVGWDVAFEALAAGAQDLDSDGFASAVTVTASTVAITSGMILPQTVTVSTGTATDFLQAGDRFRLRIRRDVANDTAAGDAQLYGVTLTEA